MMHTRGSLHRSASSAFRAGTAISVLVVAPLSDSFGLTYQLGGLPLCLGTAAIMIGLSWLGMSQLRTQEEQGIAA